MGRKKRRNAGHNQRPRDKRPISRALRGIGRDIGRNEHSSALSKANQWLSSSQLTRPEKGRILAQVADSEFRRGRFREAAEIQLQAAGQSLEHHSLWLRPYIGQIRALLKVPDVQQASMMAWHAISIAESKMQDFENQLRLANEALADGQRVQIPRLPPRVSVVATRLGNLFLQEGEPEAAGEFFNKALEINPKGACKARQGLARMALVQKDYKRAGARSMDAIRRGKFAKKTVSSWVTLISARRTAGRWRISEKLIRDLDQAPAGVRARTILLITSELRKRDMRQWEEVADAWMEQEGSQFPIVATEIKKMKLASARLAVGQTGIQQEAAAELLQTPDLGRGEWLSAAKEWVRSSLLSGEQVDIDALLAMAEAQYETNFVPRARHGVALACMMAKRHDLARPLLQENIRQLSLTEAQWGKSVWALARMENLLDNHADAAELYEQCANNVNNPSRFRLQARLLWCEELVATGDTSAIDQAYTKITDVLSSVNDADVLLNFARQLQLGPQALRSRAKSLFEAGKTMALEQFHAEENPNRAMNILFKLTRRQVVDFSDYQNVIDLWDGFSDEKRDWLWADTKHFWEYQGLLFSAYCGLRRNTEAKAFALLWLNDPATPQDKRLYLGIPYMQALLDENQTEEALMWCKTLTDESPSHPLSARAWYWLAISAYANGDTEKAAEYAQSLRQAQGTHIGLLSEWELDARALLLLTNMDVPLVMAESVSYASDFLQVQMLQLQRDIERITA